MIRDQARCPQCQSLDCNASFCRFSGLQHDRAPEPKQMCPYERRECDCQLRGLCLEAA